MYNEIKIEYDQQKAASNLKKHGVSFDEAVFALYDPLALSLEDPDAAGEPRWLLVGISNQRRTLTVVYTLRGDRIRIISARPSTRNESKQYAQGI
jgi:uncharacterized DUF497 family protein